MTTYEPLRILPLGLRVRQLIDKLLGLQGVIWVTGTWLLYIGKLTSFDWFMLSAAVGGFTVLKKGLENGSLSAQLGAAKQDSDPGYRGRFGSPGRPRGDERGAYSVPVPAANSTGPGIGSADDH